MNHNSRETNSKGPGYYFCGLCGGSQRKDKDNSRSISQTSRSHRASTGDATSYRSRSASQPYHNDSSQRRTNQESDHIKIVCISDTHNGHRVRKFDKKIRQLFHGKGNNIWIGFRPLHHINNTISKTSIIIKKTIIILTLCRSIYSTQILSMKRSMFVLRRIVSLQLETDSK